jgi:DNA polymerase II small subunit/DNA polymerase delta subunit B
VIEDLTGFTSIYIADEAAGDFSYLVEDEIVGLVCDSQEWVGKRALKIVFPDIPLSTKVSTAKSEMLCLFLSDIHIDESGFLSRSYEKLGEYLKKFKGEVTVFVLGDVSNDEEKIKKFHEMFPENFSVMTLKGHIDAEKKDYLPDPVEVELDGVRIFLSHGEMFEKYFERFKTSPDNMLLQMIKKRHLSPTFGTNPDLDNEKLSLDTVPDIFVIGHYHDPRILNYKGATIISLGSFVTKPIFWLVNLKTRETIKVDLT